MTTEITAEITALLKRASVGTLAGLMDVHGKFQLVPVEIVSRIVGNDSLSVHYRLRQLVDENTPWHYGPAVGDLQHWVESHLAEPTEVRPPEGTVALYLGTNFRPKSVGSAVAATRKLILATGLYGAHEIGKLVAEFLGHGLIQIRQTCLLKGFAIESRITLDDYCALVPYSEVANGLKTDGSLSGLRDSWPDPASDVCVLEITQFANQLVGSLDELGMVYGSPLLKHGPEHLALLLSLVWGYGFNFFMSQERVLPAVSAALPFDDSGGMRGGMVRRTELLIAGFGMQDRKRPLPASELSELAEAYSRRGEPTQRVLKIAMRWLRESLTRTEPEDAVISQGIALEALFGEPGKSRGFRKRLSSRGSWYYADSLKERHDTRKQIQDFYDLRSQIAHGGVVSDLDPSRTQGISRVLRSSIKSMIVNGRPTDWSAAAGDGSIRFHPPRSEDVIPSDKADSLSWSVREQSNIDRRLRAAWESTLVDQLGGPAQTGNPCVHSGPIRPEDLTLRQKRGNPYVIGHPARLYMAHPKWPKQPGDELDDRTLYYCSQDIDKHLRSWEKAALARGFDYFRVPNDAELYHPRHRDRWPHPLA